MSIGTVVKAIVVATFAKFSRPSYPAYRRIDLQFMDYREADALLRTTTEWRIAPEEDCNTVIGKVWMERVIKED